ncbi:MAG: glutamate racemase [Rikenellaceae bacterium]
MDSATTSADAPIGVFDSGLGGLTVWRAIRERLPAESIIYLGDGAHCPYGSRSRSEIVEYSDRAVGELLEAGCKLIVVACNTATAAAIDFLRAKYSEVEIVGMEPAVKPACQLTSSGVVGVLATERSLEGDLFHRTAAKYSDNVRVIARFGRGFVELVEQDMEGSPEAESVVREVVEEMIEEGVDQIVLGCTHYPFLIPALKSIAPDVNIIDPSPAVAHRVAQLLLQRSMLRCEDGASPIFEFRSFADASYCEKLRRKARQ